MTTSQNGWTINPPLQELTVGGVTFGGAHTGDAHVVLAYVATRYHREVERLISGTCGCYNPRKIPGTNVWSNHASATAIDCNWSRHPLGARGTYTAGQVRAIRAILAYCGGVIRWGGDYKTTVDEMHFEINKDAAAVHALAVKIKAQEATTVAGLEVDDYAAGAYPSYDSRYPSATRFFGTMLAQCAIKAFDAVQNTVTIIGTLSAISTSISLLRADVTEIKRVTTQLEADAAGGDPSTVQTQMAEAVFEREHRTP